MGAIRLDTHPELHLKVTEGNQQRQFELLRDMVSVGLEIPFGVTDHIVCALHAHATVDLVDSPGSIRTENVHIRSSDHVPPAAQDVRNHMGEFFIELKRKWQSEQPFLLAAYALWRICWIHPFEDGNGRTARAVAYMVICLRLKQWLPGKETLLHKIKKHNTEYSKALKHADKTAMTGNADLIPLALLLATHTSEQIAASV